jgi:hypothetical protein
MTTTMMMMMMIDEDYVTAAVKQIKRQLSLILSAFYSEIYIVFS